MPIKQTQRELDKEAERFWNDVDPTARCHWIDMLSHCIQKDSPEDWRRYVIQRGSGSRPTYLALYLWNRHAPPSKKYDVGKLLENDNGWPGLSSDFCKKLCRMSPLEPLDVEPDSYKLENPSSINYEPKENTMNQFNETAVAKPTLIFGRVADDMTEQDFFSALEKLEKRKETLEIARGSGSSEYVNTQIQQVNNDIAAIIKTMDEVLG